MTTMTGTPPTVMTMTTGADSGGTGDPGVCVPPADAEVPANSRQARMNGANLFIDSPSIEVVDRSSFSARTEHSTTSPDEGLVLFQRLAACSDFTELTRLCLERIATARDDRSTLRWRKDYAIALSLQGKDAEAYGVLMDAEYLASRVEGAVRGKYENEVGMVLANYYGRPALGLDRFRLGIEHVLRDGSVHTALAIEHNIGRAYAAQGEHVKASEYFKRALEFARSTSDYRLEMEVCESILEFEVTA